MVNIMACPSLSQADATAFAYDRASLTIEVAGGTVAIQEELYEVLQAQLSNSYHVRRDGRTSGSRLHLGVVITHLSGPTYDRNSTTHVYSISTWLLFFKDDEDLRPEGELVGGRGNGGKEQCQQNAMIDLANRISVLCVEYLPVSSTIRDIDGDTVYLDQGSESGLRVGALCDVNDEDGEAVGVIQITDVSEQSSTGKILKGANSLDVGDTIHTRSKSKSSGGILEVFHVPVKSAPGARFNELVGLGDYEDLSSALGFRAAMFLMSPDRSFVSLGVGLMGTPQTKPLFFDMAMGAEKPISLDVLSAFFKIRGGCFFIGGREYVKSDEYTEGEPLVPMGETDFNLQWFAGAGAGLSLHLKRNVAFSAELAYFYAGKGDDWSYTAGQGENSEPIEVDSSWVDYDHITFRGLSLRIGLTFLVGYEGDE